MTCNVYTLSDPNTREIRYVGQTISFLNRRLQNHLVQARKDYKSHLYNWIRSLDSEPIIELLEEGIWNETEQYWIAQFKAWGFNLVNMTDGGDGTLGYKPSKNTKELMSKSAKERYKKNPRSIETRRKLSEVNKKTYIVTKDNISVELIGQRSVANYIGCKCSTVKSVVTGKRSSVFNYNIKYK